MLSSFFGVLALLLPVVGLYGVVAYNVTRRTREIGIRMAIGSSRASVVQLVLEDVIIMLIGGAILGTVLAFVATHAIKSILYGVEPTDPFSISRNGSRYRRHRGEPFAGSACGQKVDPVAALGHE